MNKNILPFFSALLFTSIIFLFGFNYSPNTLKTKLAMINGANEDNERGEIKEWQKRMLADPSTGEIPAGIKFTELQFAKKFANNAALKSKQLTPWDLRGPWNVGGRTRAFAIDANNDSILFAGGVSGGLWRSTDRGNSWARVTNKHFDPDVSAIAQDTRTGHTNTWYYSSGEGTGTSASGGNSFYLGDGLYKSTDGGLTWDSIPSTAGGNASGFSQNFQIIWNVVTNPHNKSQDEVLITTYDGLYRSTNGGTSFSLIKGNGGNHPSYYTDIAIDTAGIYYATFGSDFSSTGTNQGIYRSTDGVNFTNITPANFPSLYGLVKIGINPQNHNEVYFLSNNNDGSGLGTKNFLNNIEYNSFWKYTYVSGNGSGIGGTWVDLSSNLPNNGATNFDNFYAQGGYNLVVKVHPTLPNTIFIGGTNIYRSTDGFTTSTHTTQIGGYKLGTSFPNFQLYANHHPDQHDIQFLPSNPKVMFSACDGGVYKTDSCTNQLVRWTKLDRGYFTTQFYTAQLSPDYTNDIVFGGLQDNGIFWTNSSNVTTPWHMPFNGDGTWLDMSNDGQTYYLSVQEAKIIKAKLDNTGTITSFARIDPLYIHRRNDYQFVNQFAIDRLDDKIMYLPSKRKLFRNDNLNSIPYANNTDSIATNWVQFPDTLSYVKGVDSTEFTAIACGIKNHTVYLGTDFRKVFRIDNANTGSPHLVDVTGANFPPNPRSGLYVSCIAIDPQNDSNVVVVFSNYNIYSIYQSQDAGASWIKVAGNLEKNIIGTGNAPSIRWISIMPYQGHNKYFCGTSIGLFSADSLQLHNASNAGTQWVQEGAAEFGNTIVPHIFCRAADQMVAVATHGSGIYTKHYGWNVGVGNIGNTAISINIFPNPTAEKINVQWETAENGSVQFYLYDLNGKVISSKIKNCSTGKNTEIFDAASLPSGTYILNMQSGKNVWNKKIVVAH